MCGLLLRQKVIESPGDGVTGSCEVPKVGVGNQTWVLRESNKYS